jgi:NAD+ kinase
LRWNEREKQKSFVVVEEDNEQEPLKKHSDRQRAEHNMSPDVQKRPSIPEHADEDKEDDEEEEEEGDEEEEEEEVYDIDE